MTLAELEALRTTVPLLNAVLCVDCETISKSPHDACTVCGSHSLISLFRMFGGSLRNHEPHTTEDPAKTVRYKLDLIASVHEIPATQLNHAIELITRLAEAGGDMKCLHINIESVFDTQAVFLSAKAKSPGPVLTGMMDS